MNTSNLFMLDVACSRTCILHLENQQKHLVNPSSTWNGGFIYRILNLKNASVWV